MRCWLVNSKARSTLAVVALAIGLLSSCSSQKQHATVPAPKFELKDLSGKIVSLDSFRGHPVLLDFWATWCGPCRMSIPSVMDFYERHRAEGLVVLGLNIDEDPSGVYRFVQQYKIPYPVLLAGNTSVSQDYEVDGIPHFVFIDREGKVFRVYSGFRPDMVDHWDRDLASLPKPTS